MLKFIATGDVSDATTDAVLICEVDDFQLTQQGLLPAVVWERLESLQANPKWVPGSIMILKDSKTKRPMKVAFKSNLRVIFANIRSTEGEISYRSIRDVLVKLRDSYERLGIRTLSTVFPGVVSGSQFEIKAGVIRSMLKSIFVEDNVGETSKFCIEAYE